MWSVLIPTILKFSPLVAKAFSSPIAGLLHYVLAHKFGVDIHDVPALVAAIEKSQFAKDIFAEIETEHGDILKTCSTGILQKVRSLAINVEFYHDNS